MQYIEQVIERIKQVDYVAGLKASEHLDSLAKPIGGMGNLEAILIRIATIYGSVPREKLVSGIAIFAADNGVVAEGVAGSPQEVTAIQVQSFLAGKATINAFCQMTNTDITVVDIGMNNPSSMGAVNKKIACGTNNIALGPAMTKEQCLEAVKTGIEIALDMAAKGRKILICGEMGIGNTTTSSCLAAALLGGSVDQYIGYGAGLTSAAFENKVKVVRQALKVNTVSLSDIWNTLAALGGFDIAAMVGFFIGSAASKSLAIIDGFIASVAALIAIRIAPAVKHYLVASHSSAEPGAILVMEELGFKPSLSLDMRLGEGTGAILLLPLIEAAQLAYWNVASLKDSGIDPLSLVDIREQHE